MQNDDEPYRANRIFKNTFFFFNPVYILCLSYKHIRVLLSILQILRGHMTYFVTFRRQRYENVCEIYGTYIKWPQNDI